MVLSKVFGGGFLVVDFNAGFELVQIAYCQWRLAHIDAGDSGAALSQGFAENAATTADV